MADMLNHKRPQESTWSYSNAKKAFTITTTKRLLKGSQIFDSYGRKCNSRYFVNYGFALAENEDNQVNFQFKLQPESKDPLQPVKVKILGGDSRSFQIPFDHCEAVTVRCMSYLRVVYANEEELQTILKECKGDYSSVAPVNARNEAAVLKELAKQALITLKGFPTTLERDNELLKDPNNELTMNVRNCIIMRRGEKQVCHAYIDLAPLAQKWKDMAVKPFKKSFNAKVRGNGLEPSIGWRTEQYVQQVWFPFWTGEKVEIAVTSNAHEGD
jgi:histone-lysine N-methyltransferase SETD3